MFPNAVSNTLSQTPRYLLSVAEHNAILRLGPIAAAVATAAVAVAAATVVSCELILLCLSMQAFPTIRLFAEDTALIPDYTGDRTVQKLHDYISSKAILNVSLPTFVD